MLILRIIALFACMRLLLPLYGQQPVLQGYPFAKGAYTAAMEDNGLLYCVTDFGMAIWDVADSSSPQLRSKYLFPGIFGEGQICKTGQYVVLLKERVIRVVDVSDPTLPIDAPFSPWQLPDVNAMALRDTLLYTRTGISLVTYNIADLANPVPIDTIDNLWSNGMYLWGTELLAILQDSVLRFDITGGIPVPVDTVQVQDGLQVSDAMIAGGQMAVLESDPMAGSMLVKLFDVSVPGSPVPEATIDVSSFCDGRLLAMDGEVLIVRGLPSMVYDISVPGIAVPAGAFPAGSYVHALAPFTGGIVHAMNSLHGFSALQRTGPASFEAGAMHRVGDSVAELKSSIATGHVLAEGMDSLYVLDPMAPGIGMGIRSSRLNTALDWWVFDDLLVELRWAAYGQYGLSLLRITPDGSLDSLTTLLPQHSGNTYHLGIWGNRLYWDGYMSTVTLTDIYDVTDPAVPVFLDSVPGQYNLQRDGMLFNWWPEQGVVDLYDAGSTPPAPLGSKAFTLGCTGFQGGFLYPEPDRTVLHQVGNGCYSVVDLRDTSNVASYGPFPITEDIGPMADGTGAWNKVLYIPGLNTRRVYLFDVCEPGIFDSLSMVQFADFPLDLAFVDSGLLVAFGGYVQHYDLGNVIPCLTVGMADRASAPGIKVFPNPARESCVIRAMGWGGPAVLEVRDAAGRLVRTMRVQIGAGDVTVSLTGLPAGLYSLHVVGVNGISTAKLVLE